METRDPLKLSAPFISNESHNPILEASLEKVLDAEETGTNHLNKYLLYLKWKKIKFNQKMLTFSQILKVV